LCQGRKGLLLRCCGWNSCRKREGEGGVVGWAHFKRGLKELEAQSEMIVTEEKFILGICARQTRLGESVGALAGSLHCLAGPHCCMLPPPVILPDLLVMWDNSSAARLSD